MKKILIVATGLALAIAFTRLAAATPLIDNSCQGISCNTDNSTHNAGGAGGAGGNAAAAASASTGPVTNVNTTGGNTLKIEKGAVDVDNKNENKNTNSLRSSISNRSTNKQHQSQNQSQSQEAYSSSRSKVDDSGNSNVEITDIERRQTPPAFAPNLVMGSEVCAQSQTAGGSSPVFGFSLGITHDNQGCNMRRNAATLAALGAHNAAVELMCSDDDVRAAMRNAGTPCAADRAPAPTAAIEDGAKHAALEPMAPVPN